MIDHIGPYVQRLKNIKIYSVQVADPIGNSLPLDHETASDKALYTMQQFGTVYTNGTGTLCLTLNLQTNTSR